MRYRSDNALDPWKIGPAREEYIFAMEDALLVGSMLMSLIRRCDRVEMACMAQLVNVCAPIMTVPGGAAWKQTIYYPFQLTSKYGRGVALQTKVDCAGYSTAACHFVPFVDTVAVWNEEEKEVIILQSIVQNLKRFYWMLPLRDSMI